MLLSNFCLEDMFLSFSNLVFLIIIVGVLSLWELVWKGIGMWKAARNNDTGWFVCIFIFSTMGILPIIYILTHKDKKEDFDDKYLS